MTADLERALRERGAVLGDFLGRTVPYRFAGLDREWRAVRDGCGVFVAGHRALIVARGEDRLGFLQGMLSNDVKSLGAGAGMYAALLNQAGKIVADLRVFADEGRVLLDLVAPRALPAKEALERFIVADDVELEVSSDPAPLIGIEGPAATGTVERLIHEPPPPAAELALAHARFGQEPILVLAASEIEGRGYLLCGSPAMGAALFEAACAAGRCRSGWRL